MKQSGQQDSGERSASVRDILRNAASQLDVPTVGLEAIRLQGASRQHRRRAVIASTCAVLVIGAGVLAVQQLSETRDRSTAPGVVPDSASDPAPDSTAATSGTSVIVAPSTDGVPVTRVEPAFVWNAVTPGSAEAIGGLYFGHGATEEAPYLVWSTAPGPTTDGSWQPTLYRSDDGIHWSVVSDSQYTEPEVSPIGLAAQGETLFAFGTAAATGAIPKGGAGDAVVDLSTDGGASWQHQVLNLDLRGLAAADGVASVGFSGGIAAANGVVVVVAQPNVSWDAQGQGDLAVTAHGAYLITYPICGQCGGVGPTLTVVGAGATETTAIGDDAAATSTAPPITAPPISDLPIISDLIPLSDLGIDPATVEAAYTPRAFFSTDGVTFAEASLPPLPEEVLTGGGGFQTVLAANGQFYVMYSVNSFDPSSPYGYGNSGQLVFRSSDGATWEQVGGLTSSGQELVGVLPDGTLVARSYADTGLSGISTSADGVNWILHDLSPLVEPSDGEIVVIDMRVVTVGEQGITAAGVVINDEIAEEGGRSIERDGVRLEVQSSLDNQVRAYDAETGAEIPEQNLSYSNSGGFDILADDGSVLARFTSDEFFRLVTYADPRSFPSVLLHSDDGVHWSRENLADLTGWPDARPGLFQHQDGRVLLNVIDPSQPTDASAPSMPPTIVLVGTRK